MKIVSGIFDNSVLQRDKQNLCDAAFSGECDIDGDIKVSVFAGKKYVIKAKKIAVSKDGYFSGKLKGLSTGGPYNICFEHCSSKSKKTTIKNVLVGDVWILAGQSNMQGVGELAGKESPDPLVRAFYMDDCWSVAEDPIHNLYIAIDDAHKNLLNGTLPPENIKFGTGPGVAFGKEMLRRTRVPQGLIACAHGGTSMSHWDPVLNDKETKNLFGAMVRRLRKNGGKVAGVLWYQGENEGVGQPYPYSNKMHELIAEFRKVCDNNQLPFVLIQLARVVNRIGNHEQWNNIQIRQLALQADLPGVAVVPTIDLELVDQIHIDANAQNVTGKRCAQAMDSLRNGEEAGKLPIIPGNIKLVNDEDMIPQVHIEFDNVEGHLTSNGRPGGFSLSDRIDVIKTVLRGNIVVLQTTAENLDKLKQVKLYYGYGYNPYCNITDSGGRSLPVCSLALGRVALTPFCHNFSISLLNKPFNYIGKECPQNEKSEVVVFPWAFCDSRALFEQWPQNDCCLLYSTSYTCSEDISLDILLGYDGSMSLWHDDEFIANDVKGNNPATFDKASFSVNAAKGIHNLKIILGNNNAKAWGIVLRLRLNDINSENISKGETICIPEWSSRIENK